MHNVDDDSSRTPTPLTARSQAGVPRLQPWIHVRFSDLFCRRMDPSGMMHHAQVPSDGKEDPMLMASDGQMTFSLSEKNAQGRGNVELPEGMALEPSVLWLHPCEYPEICRSLERHSAKCINIGRAVVAIWRNYVKLFCRCNHTNVG